MGWWDGIDHSVRKHKGIAMEEGKVLEATFPGDLKKLTAMSEFVLDAAREMGMREERGLFALQMAVDEAATNIVVHGYQERGLEGMVRILCWREGDEFVVQLRDTSPPFDPNQVPHPDLDAPLDARKEGGLGIYLMRKLMRRVEFSREGEENVLTMSRPFASEVQNASDRVVVSPEGRFDDSRSAELEEQLREPLRAGATGVLVDLAGVTYLGSGGLRALLIVHKELQEKGGRLLLCCARMGVGQVLSIAGFDKIIPVYASRESALQALERRDEPDA